MDESDSKNKIFFIIIIITLLITSAILVFCCFYVNSNLKQYKQKYKQGSIEIMAVLKDNQALLSNKNNIQNQSDTLNKANKDLKAQNESIKKEIENIKKENLQLESKIKELIDDNIELQKSLKKAASVGVTPQSYKIYDGNIQQSFSTKGKYLGKFLGTAYTPCTEECGNDKGITSSGSPIVPGVSVAVDTKHWPYGTVFYIKGLGYTVAMDTGSAIKGKKRFDFAVLDKQFANQLGQEYYDVYLIKLGTGKIDHSFNF